ncbi:phosphate/phosphite/phosphonate ABC transporter substrate-binding protein [Falsiroseomonas oryzae]|uniref:phosphate/phosphite/phosphonate ABC transporter substrate-binding protein n=1 Tax=Falsiroseomonas oryzae TaxID=2766473 RepID=UPI0022EBA09D|nr:PhnD/SsuA/transferrin family substrate-binding protein [Roseomonas sp. MO-31]
MELIACSRMYDVAPSARDAWHGLFARLVARSGMHLAPFIHMAPAPIEELWARPDMGCVFMCGWPWAMHPEPRPIPLAAPLPSLPRYGGRPVYMTDFVVRRDAPYRHLPDAFGGRLGWTVAHSHSGCNAPRHHLLRYAARFPFAGAVGPLVTPLAVAQAVREGRCDVGPMDGFAHDLLRRHAPERVAGLRILESTDPAPIPFLVAASETPPRITRALTDALLALHEDDEARDFMAEVLVDRFVPVDTESCLRTGPAWATDAAAAGMQLPPQRGMAPA